LIKGGPDVYGMEPLEGKKREFSTEKLQAPPVVIQIKEEMELRVCESQSFFVSNVSLFQVFEFNLFHIVDIL